MRSTLGTRRGGRRGLAHAAQVTYGGASVEHMATPTNAPLTQPLAPVAEEKNLLPLAEEGTSCCGGSSCCGG